MSKIRDFIEKHRKEVNDPEYEEKLFKHKLNKIKKKLIIVAIIIAVIVGIVIYIKNKTYDDFAVVENVMEGDTSKCRFYEYGEGFLRYSNDGLAYIKGKDTIWNQAFEIKTPVIDVCKDYVAIADQNSNDIYIYSVDGLAGKVKTTYPIIDVEVAAQGVVAAITEESDSNHIEIMDSEGNILVMGQTVLAGEGCPVDISISEDGTKLVVSYLYVSNGNAQTKVVFYNYSEIGKNEVDRIVGGFNQYKTTIVPKVEFITNDIAVAFGDNMYTLYSVKQKPSIIEEKEIDREIKSILYNEDYIGFVYARDSIEDPYDITIIDDSGEEIYNGRIDMEYKNIKFDGDKLLIYNAERFVVQTVKGKVKYDGELGGEINEVIGVDMSNRFIRILNESIDVVKLK